MRLPRTIFLLEDNPDRLAELLVVVAEIFPRHTVKALDDCAAAVAWLAEHQSDVDLISLDHDLDSVPREGETRDVDHGCGRGVADFLATQPPTCPVLVHSANDIAGTGMFFELRRAGWSVWRVRPRDHHEWVKRDWRQMVWKLVETGWLTAGDAPIATADEN